MTRNSLGHASAAHVVRSALLKGSSIAALAAMLSATPAQAQLAGLRAALGVPTNVGQAGTPQPTVTATTPSMNQIMARHQNYQARVQAAAGIVAQANAAARAAANAATRSVVDGLRPGGLVPVSVMLKSAQDPTGLSVWDGASAPTEATSGAAVNVTINQTQSRALLSWNSFDIGANTTLTFNQQGNADWVAVNRVVGGIDPVTGLIDPSRDPRPSQILGSIKADGSVFVLNRSGVMFGANAQVDLHSLLASSLELGSATVPASGNSQRALSLRERNDSFLARGLIVDRVSGLVSSMAGETHGDVAVGRGARINAKGGFVILAAPNVSSAGEIKTSVGGQVSLEAGTQIDATVSSGAADSADPDVRGLILSSLGGGTVDVSGSIEAPQGFISLGTDLTGSIVMNGVLTSTTSVSRNGKISLLGGTVSIGDGAAISITPDTSGATVPQSADSVAAFKSSTIDIGSRLAQLNNGRIGPVTGSSRFDLLPATISLGRNAIISAPNATVSIGGRAGDATRFSDEIAGLGPANVSIGENAVIDVSGVADVALDASRNVLEISPAKRNELRDTPTYREPTTDGSFTLNGATLFVDPRLSGVRADGVAWVGSPLIEAGSLLAQTGITAPELMTKGGNVTLATLGLRDRPATGVSVPRIDIASSATIDFSGGWVRYAAGSVQYSKLLTADGRVIDIAKADPNDRYIAIGGGFSEGFPQLSAPVVYANSILTGASFQPGYVEGRDAGSLTIKTPAGTIDGALHGDAVAGERQIAAGQAATAASKVAGDLRKLQATNNQLAAAGLLRVQSVPGSDIVIGAATTPATVNSISLASSKLNAAALGALSLQTSGKISVAAGADVTLAPGGALNLEAGRTITIDGKVSAPAGTIAARTYGVILGNVFDAGDDLPLDGVPPSALPAGMFDIVINDSAILSTRGRWINDALITDGRYGGPGYTSGGSISLTSAPRVSVYKPDRSGVVDLSGSILLKAGSLLDVSGGGYVSPQGTLALSGRGGNVSLINETSYFQNLATEAPGPLTDASLFRSDLTSFQVTPDAQHQPGVVPDVIRATVTMDGEIRSFGFKGGGTFALVTPDLKLGSSDGGGTFVPLDFLDRTGFGTLSLTAWKTDIIDNVFSNGIVGKTALLATDAVQIRAGETLDLTQTILPSILTAERTNALGASVSGTDISRLAVVAPTKALGDWDNLPANLILGGLTELQLLGGTISGAATASITAPLIYNAGTIRIAGGSVTQRLILPFSYVQSASARAAIALRRRVNGNGVDLGPDLSTVFGPADANGKFDENALNSLGITDSRNPSVILTNRDLVSLRSSDRQFYTLGLIDAGQGIVLADGSVTDLSGTSIRNPRASLIAGTADRIATGRMIAGGSLRASGLFVPNGGINLYSPPGPSASFYTFTAQDGPFRPIGAIPALTITAQQGSSVDLSGASDTFDIQTGANQFTSTPVWSDAGTLSALGGGDITAATIEARGGAASARGGTFEWLDPVLVQSAGAKTGLVSADQIEAAGFDSFVARGNVTTRGDVSLALARSFLLRPRDYSGAPLVSLGNSSGDTLPYADPYYAISFGASGALSITAPRIGLLGIDQVISSLNDDPDSSGTLTLNGGSIDLFGAVAFRNSLSSVLLNSASDIRLVGVQPLARTLTPGTALDSPSLSGQVIAGGNLTFRAAQVYATTGSGNLQQLIESGGRATVRPFTIGSAGSDSTVRFERNGAPTPSTPYSAGSYISVRGARIEQAGVLRAPLGRIDLGSTSAFAQSSSATLPTSIAPTESVLLAPGSLTTVSLGGLTVPYGTTTDLTEYYFTPGSNSPLTAPPAAELRLAGGTIDVQAGATVDASGGTGNLYAYEFVSGTGGSRDVLSRFNSDAFSTRTGFQYADGRQVYAILPVGTDVSALYDPIYSADYGNLYAGEAGKTVRLDGASGVQAGEYLLLPAQYALLPGAMRLVENVGAAAPLAGGASTLLDGSILVAGTYGTAGSTAADWQRRSFTVQSQAVFGKYSRIEKTLATQNFTKLADRAGTVTPRLPGDAARIVINPISNLLIDGLFKTTPATGGRGSQVDIAAEVIDVVSRVAIPRDGALTLATGDLDKLNAASLFLGGIRTDRADGSTDLAITAREINVLNDIQNPLRAPEILLAVDGTGATLNIVDGASIVATGTLTDTRDGDYNVASFTRNSGGLIVSDNSGAGAVFRLANGAERMVNRSGDLAASVTTRPVNYTIGAANLSGEVMAIDTSRDLKFDAAATLDVDKIAISADDIAFSSRTTGLAGLIITPELEQAFSVASSLTIRANSNIGFTSGEHQFNNLRLYAPGVRLIRTQAEGSANPLSVTLNANDVTFGNRSADGGVCRGGGAFSCGAVGNMLTVNADTLTFDGGAFRTYGFDSSVSLGATRGAFYSGIGSLNVGGADLTLTTPFLVDRGSGAQPKAGVSQADLLLQTTGDVRIAGGGSSATPPSGFLAPGSRLAIASLAAPSRSITIDNALLRATAGTIEAYAAGDVTLTGTASLATPSYAQSFGDPADAVTVSASGGTISLVALTGDIDLGATTRLSIGGATGKAGTLNLLASQGAVTLGGTIDAAAPGKSASLNYDAGLTGFDLPTFVTGWGAAFTGDLAIRTGFGDLILGPGQTIDATKVSLTADGGSTLINGTIDTSGIVGGAISLFARDAVALQSGALLDAHADGYAETDTRRASGGAVTLGVGEGGSIAVASGAAIDVSAKRPGDRLVGELRTDPRSLNQITAYSYVEGDQGGTLTLRAPVVTSAGVQSVDANFAGTLTGAREVSIEGYRKYDLAVIAANPGLTGVTVDPAAGVATLDLAASAAGRENFLSGTAPGTLVDFIQNFDISASRSRLGSLSTLAAYHERPGVELTYGGDITLASNWNLGAGTVDVAGAVAAGLMRPSGLGADANGAARYEVVPGRESNLMQRFVSMTYRVGGKVDGEAGVLTLRAGRNLNIGKSITDGFFAFSDQTDPAYIDAQLGGGLRTFNPAIGVQCGVGGGNPTGCSDVLPFEPGTVPSPSRTSININLTTLVRGTDQNNGIAPYSAAANAPAALGLFAGGAGDPIGSAQIFPLLADGTPIDAFSIRLVGGAGSSVSANPLHIDRASGGNVVVSGESTYAIRATRPVGQYGGGLQLNYEEPGRDSSILTGDFLQSLATVTDLDPTALAASAARVQFGASSPAATAFMRQAAADFFAAYPDQVRYLGPRANPTGFDAPLGLVIQFLGSRDTSGATLADRFAAKVADGSFGYRAPNPLGVIDPPGSFARVRTLVRTGTGSIDVAAARDIDLTNGAPKFLSASALSALASASNAAQAGGSAIYTVGHIVRPTAVTARVAGTSDVRTIDPSAYLLDTDLRDPNWLPSATGRLQVNPVYATGGGSISLAAGQDILGRRDVWSETLNSNEPEGIDRGGVARTPSGSNMVGTGEQRWRVGSIGIDDQGNAELATNIRINPTLFSSGVGALGGGDVSVSAGRDIRELTVALDTSVTTGDVGESFGSMVFGGGNLALSAGHDILGGRYDIASGTASLTAGRDIGSAGKIILRPVAGTPAATLRIDNLPEIRLTDATVRVTAGGSIAIGKISALGVDTRDGVPLIDHVIDSNALGYLTGRSAVSLLATGDVALAGEKAAFSRLDAIAGGGYDGSVMPASLEVTSFNGDIDLGDLPLLMVPGAEGQLSLLAGGTLAPVTIALDDGDASLLPGIFSAVKFSARDNLLSAGRLFSLPVTLPTTTDFTKQLYHAATPVHGRDFQPARIAVGGDLVNSTLFLSKQARISAGGDIVNLMFTGQNVRSDDVTRIVAARDILGSVAGARAIDSTLLGRSIIQGNQIIVGGPGSLYVEAGRDLGPFLGSATIVDDRSGRPIRENIPGGILAVGNDYNPNLIEKSADIFAFFGVAKGLDFNALRETYVNPANIGSLDGDLFVQVSDPFGNKSADRTRPIYSPILIAWMQQNQAALLTASFGTTEVTAAQAYTAFAGLPPLVQRKFLLANVYFNELQAPSRPDGPSYLQYIRGYRAVDTLFPSSLGYTANDLGGTNNGGARVNTGNLDLRLATIQTTRGGDVTILGPGGDAILGSVVRTSAQAARRAYQPAILDGIEPAGLRPTPTGASYTVPVLDIPIGYEGVLTLRGGSIRGFTDGDFRLNQSRLFTQQSGDIALWSSNGDLNAGQGPKNAANVPPIVVRVTPNGFAEVDSAGAVTGAGIAGFTGISRLNAQTGRYELVDAFNDSDVVAAQEQLAVLTSGSTVIVNGKTYRKDAPTITLIAPVGTVDAGDAGVRAGGDIFVAAARVANADNFKVGGASIGIPSVGGVSAPATPASAASALTANMFRATNPNGANDQRVRILVDVLGYYGEGKDEQCPADSKDPACLDKAER